MAEDRPNFYEILDLDPGIDDWPTIEARLLEKKRQWSKDMIGPSAKGRKAALYNSLYSTIEAVMWNPVLRQQEAEKAGAGMRAQKDAKEKQLLDSIEVIRATGSCMGADIAALAKRLGGVFDETEIEKRIRAQGILVEETGATHTRSTRKRERIDQVMERRIRSNLDILKIPNLYALLGCEPRSSAKSLAERADKVNREILKEGRMDPKSTARKELCGICMALFSSEEGKEKYDYMLSVEEMRNLEIQIETAGADGTIHKAELDVLIEQARERGVDADAAQEYIEDYAIKRRWRPADERHSIPNAARPLVRVPKWVVVTAIVVALLSYLAHSDKRSASNTTAQRFTKEAARNVTLNVRADPSEHSAILATVRVHRGQSIDIYNTQGEWCQVTVGTNNNDRRGWIYRPLIEQGKKDTLAVADNTGWRRLTPQAKILLPPQQDGVAAKAISDTREAPLPVARGAFSEPSTGQPLRPSSSSTLGPEDAAGGDTSPQDRTSEGHRPELTKITIHSLPEGATLLIDRGRVGVTPVTVQLPKGPHGISLRKPGYKPMWTILKIEGQQEEEKWIALEEGS